MRKYGIWPLLFTALLLLATSPLPAGAESLTARDWLEWSDGLLGVTRATVEDVYGRGVPGFDDLLNVEVADYPFDDGFPAVAGRIYYHEGLAVGLATSYGGNGRNVLNRFLLSSMERILYYSDHSAIAGDARICGIYDAVSVDAAGATRFLLQRDFYDRMVATGDLPPIPIPGARKGFAA